MKSTQSTPASIRGIASSVRERPILFSGPMVRKILADEIGKRGTNCAEEIRRGDAAAALLVQSLQDAGKVVQESYRPPMNCIAMPPASPGGPTLMQCR